MVRAIGVLGCDSRLGLEIFLFTTVSRTAVGPTQSPMQWVTGALPLGVKRPGRESDTLLHLVTRSRLRRGIPPFPHTSSWCLVKHRDNFTFTLFYCPPNSVEQSLCNGSHSPTQEIPGLSWNPKFHYCVRIRPRLTISWVSWIQYRHSHTICLRSTLILFSHLCLYLPFRLPDHFLYAFLHQCWHSSCFIIMAIISWRYWRMLCLNVSVVLCFRDVWIMMTLMELLKLVCKNTEVFPLSRHTSPHNWIYTVMFLIIRSTRMSSHILFIKVQATLQAYWPLVRKSDPSLPPRT
jgi:hypothetical protein